LPSPILARADALMQRRRSNPEFDDVPVLTDTVDADDDFPVLLELAPHDETDDEISDPVFENFDEPVTKINLASAVSEMLVLELARKIEQRLMAELPHIIEATVRDYLAEQEMISAQPNKD
jgi:hypothetical protein